MKLVIRLGDPTSHGGRVISAYEPVVVYGKPVVRVGDQCSWPVEGHDHCTIVEGNPNHLLDDIPVAVESCHTSCGAVLISTLDTYLAE